MRIPWDRPGIISRESPLYSPLILGNILLATFLAVLSAVVTILSDETIQGELALSNPRATWLTTLYLLGVNTTVPVANWFADRFGYKTMYVFGASLFSLSSGLAAMSQNFAMLGLARVLEGIGAGFIFPVGLATIVQILPPTKLPLGLVLYVGASFGAGFALGLPFAVYVTQFLSWRLIFTVMVPIGILVVLSAWLIEEETKRKTSSKFDLWGFLFFALFIASLLVALTYGPLPSTNGGWRSPYVLALFAMAALCFGMTLIIESRHPEPIIPLKLFQDPIFSVATVAMFLLGMSIFASVSTMMHYMLDGLGYEKYVCGKMGVIYGVSLFGFSILGNALIKKIPVPFLTFIGLATLVYSYFLNNELDWQTGPDQILWILFLRGVGLGLSLGPTTVQAMHHVPQDLTGKGATLLTFFRQVGGTYGGTLIAILTIKRQIFHAARFGEQANTQLPGYQVTFNKAFTQLYTNTSEGSLQSSLQAKGVIIKNILDQSFIQAINDAMIVFGYVTSAVAITLVILSALRWWRHRNPKAQSQKGA